MDIKFEMPVNVIMQKNCVKREISAFSRFGKRAIIVADSAAALESGAMNDVTSALQKSKISYAVYNRTAGVPTFESCRDIARDAVDSDAEMVIAIGGGTTIDTGKAVSLLAAQKAETTITDLINGNFLPSSLPLLAIPTASGTGSEATPLLSLASADSAQAVHMNISALFPRLALLDPRYTLTVPWGIMVDTALDTIGYAIEANMAAAGSPFIRAIAKESLSNAGAILTALGEDQVDSSVRQMMMYDSLLAGIALGQTGTSGLHEIACLLTRNSRVSHSRAIGLLLVPYLRLIRTKKPHLTDMAITAMGLRDLDDLQQKISPLIVNREHFPPQEAEKWAASVNISVNISDSAIPLSKKDLSDILEGI